MPPQQCEHRGGIGGCDGCTDQPRDVAGRIEQPRCAECGHTGGDRDADSRQYQSWCGAKAQLLHFRGQPALEQDDEQRADRQALHRPGVGQADPAETVLADDHAEPQEQECARDAQTRAECGRKHAAGKQRRADQQWLVDG
jgi:hypothetical protein